MVFKRLPLVSTHQEYKQKYADRLLFCVLAHLTGPKLAEFGIWLH